MLPRRHLDSPSITQTYLLLLGACPGNGRKGVDKGVGWMIPSAHEQSISRVKSRRGMAAAAVYS
jgi:hypothetical protein